MPIFLVKLQVRFFYISDDNNFVIAPPIALSPLSLICTNDKPPTFSRLCLRGTVLSAQELAIYIQFLRWVQFSWIYLCTHTFPIRSAQSPIGVYKNKCLKLSTVQQVQLASHALSRTLPAHFFRQDACLLTQLDFPSFSVGSAGLSILNCRPVLPFCFKWLSTFLDSALTSSFLKLSRLTSVRLQLICEQIF